MAEISFDFRNASKKCDVSSPRIVSLEIGDESPGSATENVFQEIFKNDKVCRNDVKNNSNLISECDKQSDKSFLIDSQSSSSALACEARPSDKIESTNDSDIDLDLLDLLNFADLKQAVDSGSGNLISKKITSDDKMKISNVEASGGLSDLLSSIAQDISKTDEGNSTSQYCQKENAQDCKIVLDFEIDKIECADSSSSNNSSLKVDCDLSFLLSAISIENSDVAKVGSFNSSNTCYSKVANKSEVENEPLVTDLSSLLSSIDLGDFNANKNSCKETNAKALETENESCLADLLSSFDFVKPNQSASAVLHSKPLTFGSSDLSFKGTNGTSDSFDDFTFDIGTSSSSSSSCASSYGEKESNSSGCSSTKNNLTDKAFESDSGYSSFDSEHKGFSFFDYSSDNQISLNTLLTKKSDASIGTKPSDNEEMSMSDLLAVVSPKFNDSHVSNNSVQCSEKLMNYDCIDGRISKNVQSGMETIDVPVEKDDTSICRSDCLSNDDKQTTLIDLRECLKSAEHHFIPTSPIKQYKSVESQSSECLSPQKVLFYCEDKSFSDSSQNRSNPFEFNIVLPKKKSRINTKQSLFSKALACKPKKDQSLLQKVADIKNELLNNIINRPVFIDCDVPQPIVEPVVQWDKNVLSNEGVRSFGSYVPRELK